MFTAEEKQLISTFLRAHLTKPVQVHTYALPRTLRDHFVQAEMHTQAVKRFVEELSVLCPHIENNHLCAKCVEEVRDDTDVKWLPAIRIAGEVDHHIRYYGVPSGYEVSAFLRALALANGAKLTIRPETIAAVRTIQTLVDITLIVTPECFLCPMAAHLANQFAVANPEHIRTHIVNAHQFPELVDHYNVKGVPRIILNEQVVHVGIPDEKLLLSLVQQAVKKPKRNAPNSFSSTLVARKSDNLNQGRA